MNCPICGKHAVTPQGLRKHLMGQRQYGGHEKSATDAIKLVAQAPRSISISETDRTKVDSGSVAETPFQAEPTINIQVNSDAPYAFFLTEVFKALARNKRLPKYQFERRIDAMLNIFLPEILTNYFGSTVEVVVPEFPLKHAHNNQSTNADYLLYREEGLQHTAAWILFELKTDDGSFRTQQVEVYSQALKRGMPVLYKDLFEILGATTHVSKYNEVLRRLANRPLEQPVELVYLTPEDIHSKVLQVGIHYLTFPQIAKMNLTRHKEAWELFRQIVLPAISGRAS